MTSIADAISAVESLLERGLMDDEIVLIGRMVEAGKTPTEIYEVLNKPVEMPTEEEIKTYRYEAIGQGVQEITHREPIEDGGEG